MSITSVWFADDSDKPRQSLDYPTDKNTLEALRPENINIKSIYQ